MREILSGISSNSTVMSSMIAKPSEDGNCTNWFMPNATESLGWTAGGGKAIGAGIPPSAEDLRERIL